MKLHPAIIASTLLLMVASSVFAQSGTKKSDEKTAQKLSQVQEVSTNSGRAMLVVAGEVAN